MFISTIETYIRGILILVPKTHWAVIDVVSLGMMVFLAFRKKCSVYGAIAFGIVLYVGLLLLDTAVVIRYCGVMSHETGYNLTLDFSRLLCNSGTGLSEIISNLVVFIPFGFFLSEFLSSTKRLSAGRLLGLVTLVTFSLSLFIECLQLLLRVGFFELIDLVMNTLGAFVGAGLAVPTRTLKSRFNNAYF